MEGYYAPASSASVRVSVDHPYSYNPAHYNYGFDIHSIGKRSADASYGYGPAVAFHGYGGTSYEARSPQGLRGYYGYYGGASSFVNEHRPLYAYGYGVNHIGKRSAEPS